MIGRVADQRRVGSPPSGKCGYLDNSARLFTILTNQLILTLSADLDYLLTSRKTVNMGVVQKGVGYRCRDGRAPTEGWSGASHNGIRPLFEPCLNPYARPVRRSGRW